MKKHIIVAIGALGMACASQAAVVTVVADAEIRSDTPETNYGAETTLSALETADPYYRKGYIKFDASGLGAGTSVTNIAAFTMYFTQLYARDAKFYLITGGDVDSWDESTITWSNAPANGPDTTFLSDGTYTSTFIGLSGTEAAPGVVGFVWDSQAAMDAVINELNNGDRIVTIACMRDSTSRVATFASRENTSGHPLIQMDLQTTDEFVVPSAIIAVVADTEIRSDTPDISYGAETTLSVLSTADPYYRKGYMKFDASGLGAETIVTNIDSFTLYFTQAYARDAKFFLITGADADAWYESTTTWNNAPANGPGTTFLNDGTYTSTFIGLSESALGLVGFIWDSDAAKQLVIDELNNGDRVVTIACMRDSTSRLATFASKENLSGHPVIQMKLLTAENLALPPDPAMIAGWSILPGNVMRLEVDTPNLPSRYHSEASADLALGDWVAVAHSTNGLAPFIVTNLAYSAIDGANRVIYVQADDAASFFKIIGE